MSIFRVAAAAGLAVELVDQSLGLHLIDLPKIDTPLAQLGLLFGITYLAVEIVEILTEQAAKLRELWRGRRRRAKHPHSNASP